MLHSLLLIFIIYFSKQTLLRLYLRVRISVHFNSISVNPNSILHLYVVILLIINHEIYNLIILHLIYYSNILFNRYLSSGNSFRSLHFEYLLGDRTVSNIVRATCQVIWECLQPVYLPKEFYDRTHFPNCIGAIDGKHIRMYKPNNSG